MSPWRAVSPNSDAEQFAENLRRRTRLSQQAGTCFAVASVLTFIGGFISSKSIMCLGGVGWLAMSAAVHRLQNDGYVAPSAAIDVASYSAKDRQSATPFILFLWALGIFAVACTMK